MPVPDRLRRRFQHHAWATSTLAGALVETPVPPAVRVTAHAVAADRVWHRRLTGAPPDVEIWPDLSAGAVRQLAVETAADWRSLLDDLDETRLDRIAAYQNSRGVAFQTPVADVLDHVLLHAAHHRGQACAALRAADVAPPVLDFIAWVRAHP